MKCFKDYIKSKGWRVRIGIKLCKWKYEFLAKIGLCKHEGTAGMVGAKWHYCLWCDKKILNEDYVK